MGKNRGFSVARQALFRTVAMMVWTPVPTNYIGGVAILQILDWCMIDEESSMEMYGIVDEN